MSTIDSLPSEASLIIARHLACSVSLSSIIATSLVSRKWHQFCNDPSVWRQLYKSSFDVTAFLRRSPELHTADIDWKTKYRLRIELLNAMKKGILKPKDIDKCSACMRDLWKLVNENDGRNTYYLKDHSIQQACIDVLCSNRINSSKYDKIFSFCIGILSMLASWEPIPKLFSSGPIYSKLRTFVHSRNFSSNFLITATHAIHIYFLVCFHSSILEDRPPTLIPNSTYFDTPRYPDENGDSEKDKDPLNYISIPYQKFTGRWMGCYSYKRQLFMGMNIGRVEDEKGDIMRMDISFSSCNTSCTCANASAHHPSHFCGRGSDSVGGYSILNGTWNYDGTVKFIKTYDDDPTHVFSWDYTGRMCPQGVLGRWGDVYGFEVGGCFWIWKVDD